MTGSDRESPLTSGLRLVAVIMAFVLVSSACRSDAFDSGTDEASSTSQSADTSTNTSNPATSVPDKAMTPFEIVEALSTDELDGRGNETDGSRKAREILIGQLVLFAEAPVEDYAQPYDVGTNVFGLVRGTDRADEYVIVGAHYDHLSEGDCARSTTDSDDEICNGAADNAAGVAVALESVRRIAEEGAPSRSILIAFWDGEEDGMVGSSRYLADPVVPLEDTVAYVNFDIQGSVLLPSLADTTFAVGAESGGPSLVAAVAEASGASSLLVEQFSIVFGQGRSDHAVFAPAGVPIVFFTDVGNGCYHTVDDEMDEIDFDKLTGQIDLSHALVRSIAHAAERPAFDSDADLVSHGDAVTLLDVIRRGEADLDRLGDSAAAIHDFTAQLQGVVDAGPSGFDDSGASALLGGAATLMASLEASECEPVATGSS